MSHAILCRDNGVALFATPSPYAQRNAILASMPFGVQVGYGEQKLVRYELDPAINAALAVLGRGTVAQPETSHAGKKQRP